MVQQQAYGLNDRGYRGNLGQKKSKFNAYRWQLNGIAHTPRCVRLTTWPSAKKQDWKPGINQFTQWILQQAATICCASLALDFFYFLGIFFSIVHLTPLKHKSHVVTVC